MLSTDRFAVLRRAVSDPTLGNVRVELLAAIGAAGGIVSRQTALTLAPRHVIDDAVRAGRLVRVFDGVYALSDVPRDRSFRRRAALAYVDGAALSHLDGLDGWGFPVPERVLAGAPIHLTKGRGWVPDDPRVKVHRRASFASMPLFEVGRDRLRMVAPEQAVVESWPWLPPLDRLTPLIVGMRERRLSAAQVRRALEDNRRTEGRAEMMRVTGLVASGCHSELELWGHTHVFSDARLPRSLPQHAVSIRGRRMFLDRYFDAELVDVEMDGAAYHGRPGQRERDLRRDAALATLGILTVRFSHARLHADHGGVVDDLLSILRVRRRQLGLQ